MKSTPERKDIQEMEKASLLRALIDKENYAAAIRCLEEMTQDEREAWDVQYLMGIICVACEEFEKAEYLFRKALKKKPNQSDVLYSLSQLCVLKIHQVDIIKHII